MEEKALKVSFRNCALFNTIKKLLKNYATGIKKSPHKKKNPKPLVTDAQQNLQAKQTEEQTDCLPSQHILLPEHRSLFTRHSSPTSAAPILSPDKTKAITLKL